ncbi:hypothetical protein RRSWK_06963 [Rhodopirellula sp. SWK7]|nr:hypothetical protein RRSWK_06963 [Rhodopirellula sp. SWK7]
MTYRKVYDAGRPGFAEHLDGKQYVTLAKVGFVGGSWFDRSLGRNKSVG